METEPCCDGPWAFPNHVGLRVVMSLNSAHEKAAEGGVKIHSKDCDG